MNKIQSGFNKLSIFFFLIFYDKIILLVAFNDIIMKLSEFSEISEDFRMLSIIITGVRLEDERAFASELRCR